MERERERERERGGGGEGGEGRKVMVNIWKVSEEGTEELRSISR